MPLGGQQELIRVRVTRFLTWERGTGSLRGAACTPHQQTAWAELVRATLVCSSHTFPENRLWAQPESQS